MITLLMITAMVVVSCLAAAGLIASTQNSADAARAMGGIEMGRDTDV